MAPYMKTADHVTEAAASLYNIPMFSRTVSILLYLGPGQLPLLQ